MEAGTDKVFLECGGADFCFDLETGSFSLHTGGTPVFSCASGKIILSGKKGMECIEAAGRWERNNSGDGLLCTRRTNSCLLIYRFAPVEGGVRIEMGISWDGRGEAPAVEFIAPLVVQEGGIWPSEKGTRAWRFYQNGWQCWTPSGTLKSRRAGFYLLPFFLPRHLYAMVGNPSTPIPLQRGYFSSEWFAGIGDLANERSIVAGFIGVKKAFSQVFASILRHPKDCSLFSRSHFEGKLLESKEPLFSEPLVVITGDLSGRNFEHYAGLLAKESGGSFRQIPTGWCSWYHYYNKITEEEVEKNASLFSGKHKELGVEFVQIDDGYQAQIGDWLETNAKFRGGIEKAASLIQEKGMVPGIWLAPFSVSRRSRIFREKKEWLIKNKKGKPTIAGINPYWKGQYYGLDLTNEEVIEYLRGVFSALRDYGFRFFKLDFLSSGMLVGRRKNENLTRAEAGRKALEVIRAAAGDDSYILGAGGPIFLGVGIFDAQRVGGDVAPYWSKFWQALFHDRATAGLKNSLIWDFTRCFLNGRVFDGDPDCVMLRSRETDLTEDERKTLISAAGVFAGALLFSDDGEALLDSDVGLGSVLLPRIRSFPRCPDIWKREIPSLMLSDFSDVCGKYHVLWMLNWSSRASTLSTTLDELGLNGGKYHACEFWSGRYLGVVEKELKVEGVPAHGSCVVRLTEVGSPRVIGSTIKILQGAQEISYFGSDDENIIIRVGGSKKRNASIILFAPKWKGLSEVGGVDPSIERLGEGVWGVSFELEGEKELRFSKRRLEDRQCQ
ncbi:MAG: alpha-galactosidase [Actinomycetota bacterium]|nr:alpha-galactosidase [Actinomycetota bacterium]